MDGNYTLEGILILLRHGDRGPLSHIRNISSVNCAMSSYTSIRAYSNFLQNISKSPGFSQFLGPFHNFPLLPANECALGQLTLVGVSQLHKLGHVLRMVYGDKLGIGNGSLTNEDIVVYSTRYRRTFQSTLAFLYTFLAPEDLQRIVLKESQSLAFCFNDCVCPAAETYRKIFTVESSEYLNSHPAVMKLVKFVTSIVFEMPHETLASNPHSLHDALLTYICHNSPLPCLSSAGDQDLCVRAEHVTSLFTYIDWESRQYLKSHNLRKSCLLRAYGLLRNIVSFILHMVSEKKPRIVLYSGHDKTIQYLTFALGISDGITPHYASRLIFELYRKKGKPKKDSPLAREYYFRIVFNGKDLTNQVNFCRNSVVQYIPEKVPTVTMKNSSVPKKQSSYLCPIESVVRFLHDDYFHIFNTTNFKDSCLVRDSQ